MTSGVLARAVPIVAARAVPLVLPVPAAVPWDAQGAPRCAGCGAPLIDGRRRYCGRSCQDRNAAQRAARQAERQARVWPCAHCGSEIRGGRRNRRFCDDTCRWRFKTARKARPAATDSGDWLARFDAAAKRWDAAHGRAHPWG